jgi:hypothetical protein
VRRRVISGIESTPAKLGTDLSLPRLLADRNPPKLLDHLQKDMLKTCYGMKSTGFALLLSCRFDS